MRILRWCWDNTLGFAAVIWTYNAFAQPDTLTTVCALLWASLAAWHYGAQPYKRMLHAKRERCEELELALADAMDFAGEGWAYAGEYFYEKWGAAARYAKLVDDLDPRERG